ncbi:MAG: chitobiase/beta-hexosaminidase C-terminal domain-containing protein, partial [Gammaproteobacteria bacterium]
MPDFKALPRILACLMLFCLPMAVSAGTVSGELTKWHTVVVDFAGPLHDEMDTSPNPFLDYRLQVTFQAPSGATYNIPGFFDGDGNGGSTGSVWRVLFAPDEAGTWTYTASFRSGTEVAVSLDPGAGSPHSFDGDTGNFTVAGRDPTADGFLKYGRLESIGEYYLKFRDGDYFIKGGMDSPENLFGYDGFDNTPVARHHFDNHVQDWQVGDPDWDSTNTPGVPEDGRAFIGMLNYLASQNLNSVYFMPMNIGADGKDTWPYASPTIDRNGSSSNDNRHFDISKMQQWTTAFDHAQRKGIFLHFVLSDREAANKNELDNATLGPERKLFYRELIARFGHFNALQWNICEEYNLHLPLAPSVIKDFAQYINDVDDYDHPVTVHPHGNTYVNALAPFVGDPRFQLMTVQTWQQPENISHAIEHFRSETAAAGQIVPTSVDESIGIDQLSVNEYRKRAIWDAMLSGGSHELFVRYQDSRLNDFRDFVGHYEALWFARKFVQDNVPFWEMSPDDSLVTGENTIYGGAEVLYKSGEYYAVYLPSTSSQATLSLNGAGGTYTQQWYDPRTGAFVGAPVVVEATSTIALGNPPSSVGEDWAVLIQSTTAGGSGGNEPFAQSPAPDGLLSIEAESFHVNTANGGKDWVLVSPGGESGAGAMEAAPNTGTNNKTNYESASPRLDYEVEFAHAGTHFIWIRGIGSSDFDDSLHVGLNGSGSSSSEGITYFINGSTFSWANTSLVTGSVATVNVPSPGLHTLNIWMREDGFVFDKVVLTKNASLDPEVTYGPEGPAESSRVTPTATEPVVTPAAGTYFGSVDVTMSADPGASIHYTLDGSDPTSASSLYGGPITLSSDTTVKAIAVAPGVEDSAIVTSAYVITNTLLPPAIDPPGGSYINSVTVSMTATAGTIHYTTDGSLPTTSSPQYVGPLNLTTATTVRAITALTGYADSVPAEESYTITTPGGGGGMFMQSTSGDGLVSIEAENYQAELAQGGHSWIPTAPGGQSGAGAMEAFPNSGANRNSGYVTGSPQLDYEVNFEETGTHYVWIRGYGASGTDDSLHVGLDGAAVSSSDRISFFDPSFGWSNDTMDGSVATINVATTGPHTINVWMREDGFIIDKIVLTTDGGLDVEAVYGPNGPSESPFSQ